MSGDFELRAVERKQLIDILPDVIDLYRRRDQDEKADQFENVLSDVESSDSPYSFDEDVLSDVVYAIEELGDMRASWLGSKIARRADLSPTQQGFSTSFPIGTIMEARMAWR